MEENENTELWMTRADASYHFGVCLRTIHRWMQSGRLQFERDRASGRVMVNADSLRVETRRSQDLLG